MFCFKPSTLLFPFLLIFFQWNPAYTSNICIYGDEGVTHQSIAHVQKTFHALLGDRYKFKILKAPEIIDTEWEKKCALFIIPGGIASPICKKLNGPGNQKIRDYVAWGGSYLGICAGAYYASRFTYFDQGGPLEICNEKELQLFKGSAIGPLFEFNYNNYAGARVISLDTPFSAKPTPTFIYGGCMFQDIKLNDGVYALAWADEQIHPIIIQANFGLGRTVLSGVHFEFDPDLLDERDSNINLLVPALKENNSQRLFLTQSILNRLGL